MHQLYHNYLFRLCLRALPLLALCSASCHSGSSYRQADGEIWNTAYHITYNSGADLHDSIRRVLADVDESLSLFNPHSVVSAVNRALNEVDVDNRFSDVYTISREVWELSDSVFDPTLSPLITAWGFGPGHTPTADTLRLDSIRGFIGMERTILNDNVLYKKDPRLQFNFSGVAKGYGVDCIADMLERNGVDDYLVEVGGEIRAAGINPNGNSWRIGVDTPLSDAGHEPVCVLELSETGMATSGNYRNFHRTASSRYGHTVSPRTLRPVQTDIASVTVIHPSCARADALATMAMALGHERADAILDSLHVPALFILTDMSMIQNRHLKSLLTH